MSVTLSVTIGDEVTCFLTSSSWVGLAASIARSTNSHEVTTSPSPASRLASCWSGQNHRIFSHFTCHS